MQILKLFFLALLALPELAVALPEPIKDGVIVRNNHCHEDEYWDDRYKKCRHHHDRPEARNDHHHHCPDKQYWDHKYKQCRYHHQPRDSDHHCHEDEYWDDGHRECRHHHDPRNDNHHCHEDEYWDEAHRECRHHHDTRNEEDKHHKHHGHEARNEYCHEDEYWDDRYKKCRHHHDQEKGKRDEESKDDDRHHKHHGHHHEPRVPGGEGWQILTREYNSMRRPECKNGERAYCARNKYDWCSYDEHRDECKEGRHYVTFCCEEGKEQEWCDNHNWNA
ncbi:hypothetical protein F5Y18DRAFT_440236 [Xylariaceae sp. FL1019]|nr:hypothetical protein F5Y18DRAFT_440236 [Xylariaceae sp. FL1019]